MATLATMTTGQELESAVSDANSFIILATTFWMTQNITVFKSWL